MHRQRNNIGGTDMTHWEAVLLGDSKRILRSEHSHMGRHKRMGSIAHSPVERKGEEEESESMCGRGRGVGGERKKNERETASFRRGQGQVLPVDMERISCTGCVP